MEDKFPTGRPSLHKVGVQFVADVTPYELTKLRILNGGHAAIPYPAGLLDVQFVHEAMEHRLIRAFLSKLEHEEIIPHVPIVPEMSRDAPAPDRQAMELFNVAAAAGRDESGVLAAMRAQLDMPERSLRRLCHAQFGYGPKTLERVLRFQRLLALARSDRQAGLAALAADAGYADQAHLSREVRALCGITPRAALQQLLD